MSSLALKPSSEESALQAIISEKPSQKSPDAPAEQPTQAPTTSAHLAEQSQAIQAIAPAAAAVGGFTALTSERSHEILSRAIISGDPWHQDGGEYRLTIANLMNSALLPAYELSIDGQSIILSPPFQLSDGRGAILGFIPTPEGAKVRSFYINPKTGLWHYAPDIIRGPRGEGMSQVGEAYGPASTILPIALQDHLADLVKSQGFREITAVNPDFLFAGTAYSYATPQEYRDTLSKGAMRGDFYQEVDQHPIHSQWQPSGKIKNVPQLLSASTDMTPNFANLFAEFISYSTLAGQISLYGFASEDRQSQWLFCSDDWGRTWIGNIEVVSPITSCACRRDWMSAGDMLTPLYEYSTQAGNYGDPNDTRKGLIGMWNQYLSKIPLIQSFAAWRKQKITS